MHSAKQIVCYIRVNGSIVYLYYILIITVIRSNSKKNVGKKKNTLSHTVEASRSLVSISSERTKLKANYYKQKLLLLERQTVAKEKKANAMALIAETIAAKYKT